jgi:hypothetical protein
MKMNRVQFQPGLSMAEFHGTLKVVAGPAY